MSSILMFAKHLIKPNLLNGLSGSKCLVSAKPLAIRHLFTDEVTGVSDFVTTKERVTAQFGHMKERFLSRVEEYIKSDTKMIFTEDLKNAIFLTEKDSQEMSVLTDAVKKFHSQNQTLQFGTFVFGPILMRLLHHLNEWQLAVDLFKDPELKGFFSQMKSLTMLMNLLFINGKYEECMDILEFSQSEGTIRTQFPRDCVLLYMASAYKLNTPEAYNKAVDVLKKLREAGVMATRKTLCLFAALAIKQNNADIALEVLSLITQQNYISVRNLRFQALAELERFDDLFIALKLIINRDLPEDRRREELLEETFNRIKEKVESKDDKSLLADFAQIESALIEGNHIGKQTMDAVLLSPVVKRDDHFQGDQRRDSRNPMFQQNTRRYQSNQDFQSDRSNRDFQYNRPNRDYQFDRSNRDFHSDRPNRDFQSNRPNRDFQSNRRNRDFQSKRSNRDYDDDEDYN